MGLRVVANAVLQRTLDWLPADPRTPIDLPFGLRPPEAWMTELIPGFGPESRPHITEEGRVNAVAWPYDACHVGFTDQGVCWTPEPSPTANANFHIGSTVTAEGTVLDTGNLCWRGHDESDGTLAEGQNWYNDPENRRAVGRIIETPTRAYFAGSLTPNARANDVAALINSALSGDWRWDPQLDAYDTLGPSVIGRPGLPSVDTRNPARKDIDDVIFELVDLFAVTADGGRVTHTHEWIEIMPPDPKCKCQVHAAADDDANMRDQINEVLARMEELERLVVSALGDSINVGELSAID